MNRATKEAETLGVEWVDPGRIARCSWRIAGLVGVHADPGRPARFSGIERCESIWACPVCSGGIREGRGREVQAAGDRWAARGNSVSMASFTMRHKSEDPLRLTIGQLFAAFKRMQQGRGFRSMKERLGVSGWIRSVEVTVSWRNGWHPHIHVLWFMQGTLSAEAASRLEDDLYAYWSAALEAEGARSVLRERAVKVTYGHAQALGKYLAKVQDGEADDDGWTIGREMARHDLKKQRGKGATPFQLLDGIGRRSRELWLEYVDATKGRRAIEWSRGLRDLLGLDPEQTDAQVLDEMQSDDLVWVIDGPDYDAMTPQARVAVLEAAEDHVAQQAGREGTAGPSGPDAPQGAERRGAAGPSGPDEPPDTPDRAGGRS